MFARSGPPDPARTAWLAQWTYAHRGLHRPGIPENSLAAFAGAVEAGLGVECDIQRSRDGHAMLLHDWELERLTGVTGRPGNFTSEELERIAFLDPGHYLARLDELLEVVDGRVPILIEIKSRPRYDVVASCDAVRIALAGYLGSHAVMSFDPRVARWFRRNSPETVRGLVMREDAIGFTPHRWQRRLAFLIARPEFVAYHIEALPNPFAAELRRRGYPLLTWTIASPMLREHAAAHADAAIAEGEGLA
ncbi:MAG: glycerophosphodiester phosphodiesterase family protein [Qipengyuania sp.]